ncbi:MAG: YraN family protein [Alphaproteobacteria bacterium]
MGNSRRERERRGRMAESIAVMLLRAKGYRIVARRVRLPAGEIDIVARRGSAIVFVEVKARPTRADAAASIQPGQRSRIIRAAAQYLSGRTDLAALDQRFDAVLVVRGAWPQHIINAWRESGD